MTRAIGLVEAKAADQLQKSWSGVGTQPLPPGAPGRVTGEQVGITDPGDSITFYVIGDHGGVKDPKPQNAVSYAIRQDLKRWQAAAFIWSVGDIVYFNGDASEYVPQFYEPYAGIQLPIVGVPGNHDGDTTDDPSRAPLDTFMANFCSAAPQVPPGDPQLEYGRHTQTQPWCDWTLQLKAVTIIGLYSNVPSGGYLYAQQQQWLASELAAADPKLPIIVSLHHPPLSVDAHHGGSQKMFDAIDAASQTAQRCPDVVISGHVHTYERFTRGTTVPHGTPGGYSVQHMTYLVAGNSGYHNLHQLASDAVPGMDLGNGIVFENGDDKNYGFVKLSVNAGKISGTYNAVRPGVMGDGSDCTFTPALDSF